MRCSEVNLLLLSHLDGALSEYDEARLAEHIAGCDACAREISSQKRLSGALHEIGQEEFQAPPELCSLVMTKLRTQRGKSLIWLPAAWRKAIASAAAVLLLAGGSAGIAGGLKIADIGKMIGWHTSTPPVNIETAGGVSVTENNPSEEPSAAGIAANNAYNPVITGDTPEDSVDKIKDNDAGSSGVDNDAGKITTVPSVKGPRALLGSDMEITSTVLTVAVEDMNEARAKAVALAAGAEAATQVFPEQSGDKKVVVIRIAADRDDAPGLVAALSGVGLLVDRRDESRDITFTYNEKLVQYYDLQHQLSISQNTEEQQQLEAQAASCRQQLEAFNAEAGKRVITLWLESK